MADNIVTEGLMILIVLLLAGCVIYSIYQDHQRYVTAKEICNQFLDQNDVKVVSVRSGNAVNDVVKYNVYDVCKDREGNVTSNRSLGYATEWEYTIMVNIHG